MPNAAVKSTILAIGIILAAAGRSNAPPIPVTSLVQRALADAKPPVIASLARLVFARAEDSKFAMWSPEIAANGTIVGQIARGETLIHDLASGDVAITAGVGRFPTKDAHRFRAEPGKVYIFEVVPIDDGTFERRAALGVAWTLLIGPGPRARPPFRVVPIGERAIAVDQVRRPEPVAPAAAPFPAASSKCRLGSLAPIATSPDRCRAHGGQVVAE